MKFLEKLAETAAGRIALIVISFALGGLCYALGFKDGGDFFVGRGQSYVAAPPSIVVPVTPVITVSATTAE